MKPWLDLRNKMILVILAMFVVVPELSAGQASRQAVNLVGSENVLPSNESLLINYRQERTVILRNLSKSKNPYPLRQKLKILNAKITYLEGTTKKTRKTVPRAIPSAKKAAVKTQVAPTKNTALPLAPIKKGVVALSAKPAPSRASSISQNRPVAIISKSARPVLEQQAQKISLVPKLQSRSALAVFEKPKEVPVPLKLQSSSPPVTFEPLPAGRPKPRIPDELKPRSLEPVAASHVSSVSGLTVFNPQSSNLIKSETVLAFETMTKPAVSSVQPPRLMSELQFHRSTQTLQKEIAATAPQSVMIRAREETSPQRLAEVPPPSLPAVVDISAPDTQAPPQDLRTKAVARLSAAKKGADWVAMSQGEKEMYIFSAMGALVKRDVVSMKPSYFYIRELNADLEKNPGLKDHGLDDLFLASIYENEPDARKAINKIRR